MKKTICLFILITTILLLCSCSGQTVSVNGKSNIFEVEITDNPHEILTRDATAIEPITYESKDYIISFIGFAFGDTNGNDLNTDGLGDVFSNFFKSVVTNDENRDARFAIYYEISPSENIKNVRDVPKLGKLNYKVADNLKSDAIFIKNSLENKYLELDKYKYGSLLYYVYSDSEYLDLVVPIYSGKNEIIRFKVSDMQNK